MVQCLAPMSQSEPQNGRPATGHGPNPVRVFLLSDDPLLREMLPYAFRRRPDILLVGAHPLFGANAEIAQSACDVVLLPYSDDIASFETFLLLGALTTVNYPKLVTVSMDDGVADLISSIHSGRVKEEPGIQPVQRTV